MKRMLTPGRGSNVGGTQLSAKRLCGNKFWKYLVWKYAVQLIPEEDVPEYLAGYTNLVTENHNQTREARTCAACKSNYGTEHHGHSRNECACPLYETTSALKRRERTLRKNQEAGNVGYDIIKSHPPTINSLTNQN